MRTCSSCKTEKPLDQFARKRSGHSSRCKPCQRSYAQGHYQANKASYSASARRSQANRRRSIGERVNAVKEVTPCTDCGRSFPARAMDFHHLGDKADTVARLVTNGLGWARIEAEMAKCVVLCAVCHRLRH